MKDPKVYFRMRNLLNNPDLRSKSNNKRLWNKLENNTAALSLLLNLFFLMFGTELPVEKQSCGFYCDYHNRYI